MKVEAPDTIPHGGDRYVLELSKITQEDLPEAGAKAGNLGQLARAGFPVPQGYVLTTKAYRRFATENKLTESGVENTESTQIPPDVQSALSSIAGRLNNAMLAVRSSAINEDSPDASFAGQYETVLGVKSRDELEEAVKRCWLSGFSKRATTYKQERGPKGTSDIAVLIQKLIRADAAGVAFTANPVTGAKEVLVSAVRGLGDRLVSGSATPDEWVVGETTVCTSRIENVLSEDQVTRIAELAKRVENHFGPPQDIEWAMMGSEIFLLQARPITTILRAPARERIEEVPILITIPDGYWTRDNQHFTKPISPMYVSYAFSMGLALLNLGAKDLGLPFEADGKVIGGWAYVRIVPPGGKDRRPPPVWLLRLLVRIVPSIRSQVKKMIKTVRTDVFSQYLEKWTKEWKPQVVKNSRDLLDVSVASLSDEQLDIHLSAVLEHDRKCKELHFRYLGWPFLMIGELAVTCQELLNWNNRQVFDLLSGLSEKDSEPARRLAELAQLVRSDERLSNAMTRINQTAKPEEVLSLNPNFRERFKQYLNDFGAITIGYDVIDPTIAEMPLELLRQIRSQISLNYNPTASTATLEKRRLAAEARAAGQLNRLPEEAKARFETVLRRTRTAYTIHDEETSFTQLMTEGICRYALLEYGSRLAAKKQLNMRDDIFMLTLEEARSAFKNGADLKKLVKRRWGERRWAEAHIGPASYGKTPSPPPSLNVFPSEVQTIMRSFQWSIEAVALGQASTDTGQLKGVPASPGTYTGAARIVKDESEFSKLRPGDILVCRCTTPSWSVVFSTIGALVTEAGGILSHPAIVAREYGIPAVLGLDDATTKLTDGMLLEVDGEAGTVSLRGPPR